MKRSSNRIAAALFVVTFLFLGSVASFAQIGTTQDDVAEDFRPFDFANKYYEQNGVFAFGLIDRKNGADGDSVFGTTNDPKHNNVRIIQTFPGYAIDGSAIFWNYYGGINKESFTPDQNGRNAVDLAFAFPMYVFPSTTIKNSDRQAAMLRTDEEYFEKNVLGVAAVIVVQYTDLATTKKGAEALKRLAQRNGFSVDGTPIISTLKELLDLAANGLVTLEQADMGGWERPPFAIAKAIQFPERGAIAPDAFLEYVKDTDSKPLDAELHFITQFECLQKGEKPCF
jgi:hypothetical protein